MARQNENLPKNSYDKDTAIQLLQMAIDRGRSFTGMPRLTEAQCFATATEWDTFLSANNIPRTGYWEAFEDFIRSERQNKFTVYDLRDSWRRINGKRTLRNHGISETDALCGGCYGTGWAFNELVPTEGGNQWVKLETGVRACICPKGSQYQRSAESAAEHNRKFAENMGWDRGTKAAAELDSAMGSGE